MKSKHYNVTADSRNEYLLYFSRGPVDKNFMVAEIKVGANLAKSNIELKLKNQQNNG